MGEPALETFDPYLQLKALDRRRVTFIIIGAFARVIHGTDEVTDGLDIVPSTRPENLRRLEEALRDLNAERADGQDQLLGEGDSLDQVIAFRTDGGELNVVAEPEGTRGFDDLRYAATREPLGEGLRPSVASLGDLARMLGALGRETDIERLRTVRRVIELERELGLGLEI